jgi:hypothetical protein
METKKERQLMFSSSFLFLLDPGSVTEKNPDTRNVYPGSATLLYVVFMVVIHEKLFIYLGLSSFHTGL